MRNRALLPDWLLLVGFVLLVVASVWTVALPELSKEPEADSARAPDAGVPAR